MTTPPQAPIQKYIKVTDDSDLSGYWVDALGWIASYFAQLEGLSYEIIESLGTLHDQKHAMQWPYQRRSDFAKRLICARLVSLGHAELAKEWATLLREAKNAAPLRNKILHNPLRVNPLSARSIQDPEEGIVLVHEPRRPLLKLGTVQAFAQSMIELNSRMLDLKSRTPLL